MKEKTKQNYIEAGEVVQKARKKARDVAEPGTNLEVIAEEIEGLIRDEGLEPAFPVNLSIDDEAAHYSPPPNESRELKASDVLKIDIGAHKDGYIADTALTVNPSSEKQEMIEAVEEVLEEALKFVEPGITVGELGTFISNQVPEQYSVVRNLTGHYIDEYTQHAGVSIPNIPNSNTHVIEEGDAIAVEPFITDGSGKIKNGKKGNIYIHKGGKVRDRTGRKLLKKIKEFQGLPFSSRWIKMNPREKIALKKLVNAGAVKHYPVLKEVEGGTVAQAEHTILVGVDDGENIVTTRE
jgi:methionyl aminopeptidase